MLPPDLIQFSAIALAALAVGGVVYVLVVPYFSGERKVSKRVEVAAQGHKPAQKRTGTPQQLQTRRRQVQDTLKEIEAKQRRQKRVTLRTKLMQAGLNVKPQSYYIFCVVLGLTGGLLFLVSGFSPFISLLGMIVCGVGLPRWLLGRRIRSRQAKFVTEFANAIDIIVRGIRSGLPLADCMEIIATEAPEPVRSEFVELVEQQRIGIPLSKAFMRLYERVPLQEVSFFSIVIAIQAQTGGNLAEALSNLSGVLRDRYRMQAKVKALSAEAKASAMIIGALPPLVGTAVYFISPDYISLLWEEKIGQFMLVAGGTWMLIGILVMRKMINFNI
ncbi:type II secretion system F family protein [Methyloceanibacter sp.]|uniref:type II secretion system F family protein n=1 Tax=Methyloceanibacter sp. TaxID=1965321 RepID=UPI0025F22148|nr:type II secretion system F family protein [Methyloceanibacter sp.]